MTDITQRIACKAVIGHGGKVLVLREAATYIEGTKTGGWHCPGGRLNPGEPFLDGLRREVMEETGLSIATHEPFYVGEWFPIIRGQQNQIVAVFFACTLALSPTPDGQKLPEAQLSEEHDAYRWVTAAEAEQLALMPPEHDVLVKYFARFA